MTHVPDWTERLQYLVGNWLPRSVSRDKVPPTLKREIGTIDNMTKLARVLGVNRTTVYAAPSEATLEKVKALYGIEPGSECEGEFQAGSIQDFIDEYRTLHQHTVEQRDAELGNGPGLHPDRTDGAQLRLIVVEDAAPIVESLGSIEVCATAQFTEGADGSLSGTVVCRLANLEDVRIAVRFCKVRLLRTPEFQGAHRGERPKPIEPVQNDHKVEVTIQRVGTSQRPTVEIKAASCAIGMVNLPDDLWPVLEAKEGDQFEAQLIVYLRDCTLISDCDDAKPIGSEVMPDDGNSFIRPGWDRLGKALPLIKKRFEELRLSDGETDWALLHRYVVQLAPVHSAGGANDAS
jgi:hypothetical protein